MSTNDQAPASGTPQTSAEGSAEGAAARPAVQRPAARGHGPGGGMGMPTEKPLDMAGTIKRLLRDMRGHYAALIFSVVLAAGSVVLAVISPKLLGNATNLVFGAFLGRHLPAGITRDQAIEGLRQQGEDRMADVLSTMQFTPGEGLDKKALAITLGWVLLCYVGSWLFGWIQGRILAVVVQETMYKLRKEVAEKLTRLPLSYVDKQSRGEILSRVTNDVDNLSQTLNQTLSGIVTSVFTVIGVLIMMFIVSPLLALIAVITVPVAMVITVIIAKRSQPQFLTQWRSTGELNGHVEEIFTGHALVKVYGQADRSQAVFDERNEELYGSSFKAQFISGTIQPSMSFVSNLNFVAMAVVGGLRVASGSMSVGDVQAMIQYSRQFSQPITQIASMMNLLQSGMASAERVYALLDAEEQDPDPSDAEELGDVVGRVEFRSVDFSYEPTQPLIEELSLLAEPGQTVAIVGPTGAGKTTLVNLIMRFYEIQGGVVSLDGHNTRHLKRGDLRSSIGMVLQDAWLFEGTIEQNIAYPIATEVGAPLTAEQTELVMRAAKATHVDDFVRTLPEGYETVVTDAEGGSLSAGERQLITIARAFVADPAILILDEATSSVDTRTEVLVQRAMNALRVGRTSFVIAHRLSTITGADTIVVMEKGHIVEQGSHEELLELEGAYHRLYNSQFAAAVSDG